jgi:hypothetical protein
MKKSLQKFTIVQYDNPFDAAGSILSGLLYFWINHTIKTSILLIFMAVGPIYIGFSYFTTEKSKMMEAKPIEAKPIGATFSLIDIAYAQTKPENPIWIKGNVYGFADTTFKIWKLRDEPTILVWNTRTNAIFKVEIPSLGDEVKMKSYAK